MRRSSCALFSVCLLAIAVGGTVPAAGGEKQAPAPPAPAPAPAAPAQPEPTGPFAVFLQPGRVFDYALEGDWRSEDDGTEGKLSGQVQLVVRSVETEGKATLVSLETVLDGPLFPPQSTCELRLSPSRWLVLTPRGVYRLEAKPGAKDVARLLKKKAPDWPLTPPPGECEPTLDAPDTEGDGPGVHIAGTPGSKEIDGRRATCTCASHEAVGSWWRQECVDSARGFVLIEESASMVPEYGTCSFKLTLKGGR